MSTRAPGQRPAWCNADPEEGWSPDGARIFHTWAREFGPRSAPWGVDLIDEDVTTLDGIQTSGVGIRVYDPERTLTLDEAEQFALAIIEAVKAAQNAH